MNWASVVILCDSMLSESMTWRSQGGNCVKYQQLFGIPLVTKHREVPNLIFPALVRPAGGGDTTMVLAVRTG
jgi:hypothetical protein